MAHSLCLALKAASLTEAPTGHMASLMAGVDVVVGDVWHIGALGLLERLQGPTGAVLRL